METHFSAYVSRDEKTDEKTDSPVTEEQSIVDCVCEFVDKTQNPQIVLLRQRTVVMWVFRDFSFLNPNNSSMKMEQLKVLEDEWGRKVLKQRRPDLRLRQQWTGTFGEHLFEELCMLSGEGVSKPVKKENFRPDWETPSAIVEVKTGTYYTQGTAGEKILGVPFKYADIPNMYAKPLHIVCIGGAEKYCREQGIIGECSSLNKKRFLDFYREQQIEFIGATDIVKQLIYSK